MKHRVTFCDHNCATLTERLAQAERERDAWEKEAGRQARETLRYNAERDESTRALNNCWDHKVRVLKDLDTMRAERDAAKAEVASLADAVAQLNAAAEKAAQWKRAAGDFEGLLTKSLQKSAVAESERDAACRATLQAQDRLGVLQRERDELRVKLADATKYGGYEQGRQDALESEYATSMLSNTQLTAERDEWKVQAVKASKGWNEDGLRLTAERDEYKRQVAVANEKLATLYTQRDAALAKAEAAEKELSVDRAALAIEMSYRKDCDKELTDLRARIEALADKWENNGWDRESVEMIRALLQPAKVETALELIEAIEKRIERDCLVEHPELAKLRALLEPTSPAP